MTNSPRYVFDTNALVSVALFKSGKPGRAFYREKFDDYLTQVVTYEKAVIARRRSRRGNLIRIAKPSEIASLRSQ